MSTSKVINIDLPPKLKEITKPNRYKILYGGRGGGKSWAVARYLLAIGMGKKTRILCAREFQNSIADSVHKLLSDQIIELGLTDFYQIQRNKIIGINGTEFGFEGLKHNITSIKSYEGADVCWVEEAHTVSKSSWDILIPTIRKKGSEIWLTFNPDLETDETYQRFILKTPPDALVLNVNWRDNPWFPGVLQQELDHLKEVDHDAYLNVWEGNCRQNLDGAVYAKELRLAREENRITRVPSDATKPVDVYFDLGWADKTSMWFGQSIAFEYRIVDFYQNRQYPISHYLQIIQNKGYVIGTIWLPHDASAKQLGTGKSIEELVRAAGYRVNVLPRTDIQTGINAARTIFQQCYFDEQRCSDGIQALMHYRYEVDEDGKWSQKPLHDEYSHAADAFRYLAMAISERRVKKRQNRPAIAGGWMG